MKVGLVGYHSSGRTTLLDAVSAGARKGELVAVPVPDARFDKICESVKPKKIVRATVDLQDNTATLRDSGSQSGFAENARRVDALLHVVREFDSPTVPFHAEPNPDRDHTALETELVLADLGIVENRLGKLAKSHGAKQPGSQEYLEEQLFKIIGPALEEGIALRRLELSDEERERLGNFQMLTSKPMVVAVNCSEHKIGQESAFEKNCKDPAFRICAEIEKEIAALEESEREDFLRELGIAKPAAENVVRAVYSALGLISFYTAGDNITQAWPLRKGATAIKAADTIHSDIARGFIRAEIVHYDDFAKTGDIKACYQQGLMKLEGKDYVVQDGDIINIRNKS